MSVCSRELKYEADLISVTGKVVGLTAPLEF
jgi:hypothetical protein